MRRAAQRAGIVLDHASDQLAFMLEPEAAALHARMSSAPPFEHAKWVQLWWRVQASMWPPSQIGSVLPNLQPRPSSTS